MRRVTHVAVALLAGTSAISCTTRAAPDLAGDITLGEDSWELADVDCSQVGSSRVVGALALPVDGAPLVIDAELTDGSATATVRRIGEQERWVGSDLAAEVEGESRDRIEVSGPLVAFEGPDRKGEEELRLALDCPRDSDPGGGYLSVAGSEVTYDQVTCVELEDQFEARGRSTEEDRRTVTVTRSTGPTGTEDRLDVTGEAARRVSGEEMFEIRGPRVTLAGPTLEGEPASLDLTCGLRVQQPLE